MMNDSGSKGFSHLHREKILSDLSSREFDVVIIGGGITGAGIALDAASRGLTTALIEKGDFASGTSSRSTKLIHGGLRYLKQLQIHVVAETGRERAVVHRLVPHLVVPRKMILPVLKGSSMGMGMISLGLWLYDLLAGVKGSDRKRMLGREETLRKAPLLPADKVKGSGYYAEYMTDDARLTIEVIKTAARQGALCINYAEVTGLLYDQQGTVSGVTCHDRKEGNTFSVRGRFVVNAAGPWVDDLRRKDNSLKGKHLFITKGVHLVFDKQRFPLNNPIYFDIPDGRMLFLIPRHGIIYAGTTDTPYHGDKDDPPVTREDVDYILNAIRYIFPGISLSEQDVLSSWAGIRPLIYEEGKSASEISRKDEVFISEHGLISMAGGKLTGYRKMAEKVVNTIVRRGGKEKRKCRTKEIPLTEEPFSSLAEVREYLDEIRARYGMYDQNELEEMVMKYGRKAGSILAQAAAVKEKLILAEAAYTIDNEMVYHPLDFLERRSGRLLFDMQRVREERDSILNLFAGRFGWDAETLRREKETVNKRIREITPPFEGEKEPSST